MKKTKKLALATLATAIFATSAFGLAACSKDSTGSTTDDIPPVIDPDGKVYTVTFDANEGAFATSEPVKIETGTNGKLNSFPAENPTYVDHTFDGWNMKPDGTGDALSFSTVFTEDTTVYAKWIAAKPGEEKPGEEKPGEEKPGEEKPGEEKPGDDKHDTTFTITLVVGEHGTTAAASVKTGTDGKLATLPAVTAETGWTFDGWYNAASGGVKITADTVFEEDASIYAHYTEEKPQGGDDKPGDDDKPVEDGIDLLGATASAEDIFSYGAKTASLGKVTADEKPADEEDSWEIKYQIAINLEANTDIQFKIGGKAVAMWVDGKVAGSPAETPNKNVAITPFNQNPRPSTITATVKGRYTFYLKYYGAYNETAQSGGYVLWVEGPEKTGTDVGDKVDASAYYLVKATDDWAIKAANVLAKSAETPEGLSAQYTNTFTLAAGDTVKIRKGDSEGSEGWYGNYEGNNNGTSSWDFGTFDNDGNLVISAAGKYTFYFKLGTDGGHSIWVSKETSGGEQGGDEQQKGATFIVGGKATELTDNTASIPTSSTADIEYLKEGVPFATDDVVTFTVDGKALTSFKLAGESHGVSKVGDGLKVLESGSFNIYVRFFEKDDDGEDRWVIEMTDGKVEEVGNLVDGCYYIVGSMNGWSAKEKYAVAGGTVTLKLNEGESFKIAKYVVTDGKGGIDWNATNYGYSDVTTGKGYVKDDGGNITVNTTATYTVKLNGSGKVEISSTEIAEPAVPVENNPIYLKGTIDGANKWGSNEYNLKSVTPTGGAKKQYSVTITVTTSIEFRLYNNASSSWIDNNVHGSSSVKPTYKGDNMLIEGAGTYTFVLQVWNDEGTDISILITKA